jgi:hypothetical protein
LVPSRLGRKPQPFFFIKGVSCKKPNYIAGGSMTLKPETLEKVRDLSSDPDHAAFFEQLENYDYSTELVDEITDIFIYEMGLHPEQRKKFNFALRLAYLAGRAETSKE